MIRSAHISNGKFDMYHIWVSLYKKAKQNKVQFLQFLKATVVIK